MAFEIGRVCMKLAGRDAGKLCVIIDTVDAHTVLIDGETRRRKCNVVHLEPTPQSVHVSKGADHAAVLHALGIKEARGKAKTAAARPGKVAPQKPAAKTVVKKVAKKPAAAVKSK